MDREHINDLTKLDTLLDECVNLLGEGIRLSETLNPDSKSEVHKQIAAAIGTIFYAKTFIPELARANPSDEEIPVPDPPLTTEQQERVSKLTVEEIQAIDEALMRNADVQWRKVARVVGSAMGQVQNRIPDVMDLYYAQRLRRLVESGLLESQGNIDFMRFSEVRIFKSEM